MEKIDNKVYIKINKVLCKQTPSKYEDRPNYNIMKLPEGTVIDGTDYSYAIINPIVMFEDKKNSRMFCAIYDKDKLKDNTVSIYRNVDGQKEHVKVDVDKLRDAVAAANHAYYEKQKETHSADKKESRAADEKMQPLTAESLKKDEEMSV